MNITFYVRGRNEDQYLVRFIKNYGLKANCTCLAGEKGQLCYHILNLLNGDITALLSENVSDVGIIHNSLKEDMNLSTLLSNYNEAIYNTSDIETKFTLAPTKRRKTIQLNVVTSTLNDGGFLKGNGEKNFLDLYDKDDNYIGSIKTPKSVFNSDINSLVGIQDICVKRLTDRQVHSTSQGLYCYISNSVFSEIINNSKEIKKIKLDLSNSLLM